MSKSLTALVFQGLCTFVVVCVFTSLMVAAQWTYKTQLQSVTDTMTNAQASQLEKVPKAKL